jgi:uncharacterized repeat protein (TIGR04076 family)
MAARNLKITCIKAEGKCGSTKVGSTFSVRNEKLFIPDGQGVCIYALGSLLGPIIAATVDSKEGKGVLDILDEWTCPDSKAKVVFKIEEEKLE